MAKSEIANKISVTVVEDFFTGVSDMLTDACDTFVADFKTSRESGSERAKSIANTENETVQKVAGAIGEMAAVGYTVMTCPATIVSAASRAINK
jgi:hypothetical protein